jgi:uncharacterized cofD-like protein
MAFNKYITASPAVVCIGGGTGMSTMLRGLKNYVKDITAIVTVSDDGGGSGVLRDELGMPPPGDIRNCIQALSNTEPTMEKLWSYRFESGSLKGQCFGNLLLAAMNGISESFEDAVAKVSDVLAITGRVLPVTDEDVNLKAELEDGSSVVGESAIARQKRIHGCRIKRVSLVPERPPALYSCVNAIEKADMIILGPGSLYTSVIPNLLVEGIAQAIMDSDAIKVYICNVMTQPGRRKTTPPRTISGRFCPRRQAVRLLSGQRRPGGAHRPGALRPKGSRAGCRGRPGDRKAGGDPRACQRGRLRQQLLPPQPLAAGGGADPALRREVPDKSL